jgi:putative transposase
MLADKRYCYPLTITDATSRYLLCCEAFGTTQEMFAAFFGLSKLSVWWLRLGVGIERIKPGNPQQNGRHERMHLTLNKEATKPAAKNLLQQQAKFDHFID